MLRFIVSCVVFVLVSGQTTDVSQCIKNDGPLPLNAYVHGCTTPPCLLPQLQDVVVDVVFKAPRKLSLMTTLATAIVNFGITITIPYELGENAKSCNFFTNTYCPLLEGEIVQYQLKMFIESFFPVGTEAIVEFRIVDNGQNNEIIWCIRLPIRVEPAVSATLKVEGNSTLAVL